MFGSDSFFFGRVFRDVRRRRSRKRTAVYTVTFCACAVFVGCGAWFFCGDLEAQERSSAEFDNIFKTWQQASPESAAKVEGALEVQVFAREFLGEQTVDEYLAYRRAEPGSAAEKAYLEKVHEEVDAKGLRWERAKFMLESYLVVDSAAEVLGMGDDPAKRADIALPLDPPPSRGGDEGESADEEIEDIEATATLPPPRLPPPIDFPVLKVEAEVPELEIHIDAQQTYLVGRRLEIQGSLNNNSESSYIYLTSSFVRIKLPRKLAEAGGWDPWLEAEFGKAALRPTDDSGLVAISPRRKVYVAWRARTAAGEGSSEMLGLRRRIKLAQLKPDTFGLETQVEFATTLPKKIDGRYDRRDWRQKAETHREIVSLEWDFFELLPWIWSGGILILLLQMRWPKAGGSVLRRALFRFGRGLIEVILLTSVVAVFSVLFDQLPTLLPSINVKYPFQAAATGAMIQLLGYSYFRELIEKRLSAKADP